MDKWVLINDIKPDPQQPRKIFSPEHLEGLASSLKVEGMINPIEVDGNLMIITGECRWKAAQLLNWTKVPVRINSSEYSEYERLRHQMAENVHQSGSTFDTLMNPIDTAKGYAKLINLREGKTDVKDSDTVSLSRKETYGHVKELAGEIGVVERTITRYLKLLQLPKFAQEDIIAGRSTSHYQIAEYLPVEFKERVQRKIAGGEFEGRKEIADLVKIVRTVPELAKIQLEHKYKQRSIETNRILNGIVRLALALEGLSLEKIDIRERGLVVNQLKWIKKEIEIYLTTS